jgi:hypothetical protein
MQILEDTISEVEEIIMKDANRRKVMTETVDNISSWEKARILRCTEEIKKLVNHIAQKLSLEKRGEETKGQILGSMAIQWVNLEEIRSKRLRGYGEVPNELREFLDPQVDRIMSLVDEISKIASSREKDTEIQRGNP